MKCQKCNSERIAEISAKCSDCCTIFISEYEKSGYVPSDMGIGGGDYIDMHWCLECGQIQGEWPKLKCTAEEFNPNACTECGWEGFNEVGECENCGHHKTLWCPRCENETTFAKLGNGLARCHVDGHNCVVGINELAKFNSD